MTEITDWVNAENMVGDYFYPADNIVMSVHCRKIDNKSQYAIAKWWYGNPTILVIIEDDKTIYEES